MIDTHTHLYMPDSFPDGGKAAVARAVEAGVEMMVLPSVDRESVSQILNLHKAFPRNTAVALALHPTEVEEDWKEELAEILDNGSEADIVAIGETGVDLHWEQKSLVRQMDAFGEQIQIALDRGLPVIVHSRDAIRETAEVISAFGSNVPSLVFHSFTAGIREAETLLEAAPEAFFGINGVLTFKNAEALREAVRRLDSERIVLETDAPFLAPVPHRGTTNESAYIPLIARTLAQTKSLDTEEVKRITTKNAKKLFPKLQFTDSR